MSCVLCYSLGSGVAIRTLTMPMALREPTTTMNNQDTNGIEKKQCYQCMGLGRIKSESWGISWPCPTCGGNGWVRSVNSDTKQ